MAHNPSGNSYLDSAQITKKTFDSDNDAVRIVLAESTGMAIELSADDGDSVTSRPESLALTGTLTTSSTETVIAETSCVGMRNFTLYAKTILAITGAPTLTVELSPSDSSDFWFTTSVTLSPSATLNTVVASSLGTMVARRIRVKTSGSTSTGTANLALVTN